MKNILFDINHPAHVHLFKNVIYLLKEAGNNVLVTVKNIPSAKSLLNAYGIDFIDIGKKSDSISGKFINQFKYDNIVRKIVNENKIDIGIGVSVTLAHVSKLTKMVSFILDDDDSAVEPLFVKLAHPFSDYLISPDVLDFERKKKNHITYAGYHELSYLHPKRFVPDKSVLNLAGVKDNEKYSILRFNSFKAHHDIGASGISNENKLILIKKLESYGKVFITSEKDIDSEFMKYKINIPADKIHSFIIYFFLLVGDSQTMTSEASMLGIPSLRMNSFVGKISYLEEQEHKFALTYGFRSEQFNDLSSKIDEIFNTPDVKEIWKIRKDKMLSEKIDVCGFLFWLISNYPESISQYFSDRNIQYNFR